MSYESAPATAMLATACAACGRPLLDSDSVEAGLGPECRKRHGFTKAQAEPSWYAVKASLDGIDTADLRLPFEGDADAMESGWRLGGLETRALANRIVSRIAVLRETQGSPKVVAALVCAVGALGYQKLATVLAGRLATAELATVGESVELRCAFNEAFLDASRRIPGRRWDGTRKLTIFPAAQLRAVLDAVVVAWGAHATVVLDGAFSAAGEAASVAAPPPVQAPASAPKPAPARRIEWAAVGSSAWIDAPYSPTFTAEIRGVRSRRWDAVMRLNTFHPRDLERVLAIARLAFPELEIVEHGAEAAA